MFLLIPSLSQADYCSDMKERYWKCVRSSMTNEKCADGDNISIPSECLNAGAASQKNGNSSPSEAAPKWDFLKPKKEPKSVVVTESKPQKSVQIVNIKSLNNKKYLENEDDINQFVTNLNQTLLNAIKDGKKVRLQYQ